MPSLKLLAPSGCLTDYDRSNLMIYAELLDADARGVTWFDGAADILGINPDSDGRIAELCWKSHLDRARWIMGEGLICAIEAFGRPEQHSRQPGDS